MQEHQTLTPEPFSNLLDPVWIGKIIPGGSVQGRLHRQAVNLLPPLAGASSLNTLEIYQPV